MSAAKFAQGPWKLAPHDPAEPDILRVEAADGSWYVIASIPVEPADVESTIVDHANARLITAAPDLHAAAEKALHILVEGGDTILCDVAISMLRAALAKARGEAVG